jgi:hypothetical protein
MISDSAAKNIKTFAIDLYEFAAFQPLLVRIPKTRPNLNFIAICCRITGIIQAFPGYARRNIRGSSCSKPTVKLQSHGYEKTYKKSHQCKLKSPMR